MRKLPFRFTSQEIIDQGRTLQENVETVRQWLSCLDDQTIPRVQDELIVIFLLSCDNDIPLTKNTISMYYKCKRDSPEIFDNREMDRADLKKAMKTIAHLVTQLDQFSLVRVISVCFAAVLGSESHMALGLRISLSLSLSSDIQGWIANIHMSSIPVRTDENYAIHYFKLNDTNYLNFDLVPIMKLTYMLLDITQENNLPRGLIVIIDTKGVGLMHLTRMKIGPMKSYFQFLQEGFPLQMKVIHIINAVYFFDKIMNLIRFCTKSELIEMIKIHPPHKDQAKLFSLVPKKCWPEDYGGDLPSARALHEKTVEQFEEKQEFWRLEQAIRSHD